MGIKKYDELKVNNVPQFAKLSHLPKSVLDWLDYHQNGALIIWNQYNRICYASQSIKRLFHYEAEEMIGQSWTAIMEKASVSVIKNHFNKNLSDPRTFYLEIKNKEQKIKSIECMLSKYTDEETNEVYCICYISKYLQQATTREELVFSEKMAVLGQLTAGIAHEIRNPLTSIKGFLQLLQAGVNHKEEYYKIMLDEIEKMESVTSELLYLAKPLTDARKLEDVSGMIEDVVTLLHPQARMKKIEISVVNDESLRLLCNRSQIKQIFINLYKLSLRF